MLKRLVFAMMSGLLLAGMVHAQFRTLPPAAKRATVGDRPHVLPYVELGGKVLRLAPGGVIYDQNNRTLVHGALPAGANVAFTTDMHGDISRIYILTPQEQAQLDRRR
ncbi:MAG: hypothetical protein AAB325_04620 [Pseudomonadota bacterium]